MKPHGERPDAEDADDAFGDQLRRALRDEAPPAAVRTRALALQRPTPGLAAQAAGRLRRLLASVVAGEPGPALTPALGVRAAAAPGRQWLLRAEDCELDLRVSARGDRWAVSGQLFGALPVQRVLLSDSGSRGHAAPRSMALGRTREFLFADLDPGRYHLCVQGDDVEVVVPEFDVGTG